jgi:serpin B
MTHVNCLAIVLLGLVAAGTSQASGTAAMAQQTADAPAQSGTTPPQIIPEAAANRAFGARLYQQLAQKPGNVFISPISLAGAFGPVAAGAQGETRAEIGRVLGFSPDEANLHRNLGGLLTTLQTNSDGARVSIANALWLMKGFAMKPAFVATARNSYDAEVDSLDFRDGAAAAKRINGWVDQKTKGRIPKLIEPASLDEMTRVVVTNAVHFLGDWAQPFNASNTRPQPFHLPGGATRQVPMMHGKRYGRYAEADGVQLLELPYKGERLSMVAILPKERGGLASLEQQLSDAQLGGWLQQLDSAEPREVRVDLPKVEFRSSYQLVEPLSKLGLKVSFVPGQADFRGIADVDLFISQVVQKTFVRIDEKGTEAAAATAVEVEATSAPAVPPPAFTADHPFLVLIRDRPTGAVLFMGRIADPAAS